MDLDVEKQRKELLLLLKENENLFKSFQQEALYCYDAQEFAILNNLAIHIDRRIKSTLIRHLNGHPFKDLTGTTTPPF